MTGCPRETDLEMFVAGSLPGGQRDEVAAHLDACRSCRDVIETLSDAEPFLSEVARHLGRPTPDVDEQLARVMAAAQGGASAFEARSSSQPGSSELPDGFLTASDDPELLGVLGTYRVRRIIGHGGMGVVLEAEDAALKRVVAIKVLAAHVVEAAGAVRRFVREARAAAAVTHENVVTVYAVEQSEGIPYLVMEYVEGVSLEQRIRSRGRLDPREVVRTAIQIASGLAAAHARNLIHRDIKPGNILLEQKTGRAKISDFGLAHVADKADVIRPDLLVGTPEYMAPEQARGEVVDHRSDLFSLGSVIYAMCSGQTPFAAASTRAVITSVAGAEIDDVSELSPETPDWLVDVIRRLHAETPADRFQSAAEVARVLREELLRMKGLTRLDQSADSGSEPNRKQGHRPGARSHDRSGLVWVFGWIAGHRWITAATVVSALFVVLLVLGSRFLPVVTPVPSGEMSLGDNDSGTGQEEFVSVGPFAVFDADGGNSRRFSQLSEAAAAAHDGEVVEVDGDGPFESGMIDLGSKAITLRAAAGRRPRITLAENFDQPDDVALIRTAGRLRLEGIEFVRATDREPGQLVGRPPDAILVARSAPLEVINCRFTATGPAVGLMAQQVARCQISNCEFVCLRGSAVDWACPDGGRLEMSNCVQVGQLGVFVHFHRRDLRDVSVRVDQSTFVAGSAVRLAVPPGRIPQPIEIVASFNVFDTIDAVLEIERPRDMRRGPPGGRQPLEGRSPSWLHWMGNQNLFRIERGMMSIRHQGRRFPVPWAPRRLRDWEEFWGGNERGSLETSSGEAARALSQRADDNPSSVTARSFRLRPDSPGRERGPTGRDLGARVEWVGPGSAFETWKRSAVTR
ncbi:MAG TPA: hypothetical protein DCE43_05320 [Planctomycetaceae bacterium]|nr:hypothetical protein [Planctomycetaceae bacterium]